MGFIRIVNPKTGQTVIEEHDDGTIKVISEEYRKAMEEFTDEGRVPTNEELRRMVREIELAARDIEPEDDIGESVVSYSSGPIIDSDTWDASAAKKRIAKWASSDGSGDKDKIDWSKYSKGFLIINGPRDNFGSYSYPHHDIKDGTLGVHKKGVIAAMAFLLKVRPPETKSGYAHLSKHYKAMDMEPPPLNSNKGETYTDEEMTAYFGEGWRELIASVL